MKNEAPQAVQRQRLLLDPDWKFHLGDIALPVPKDQGDTYMWVKTGYEQGVAHPDYDDSGWRQLDLPHDWAVEGAIDKENNLANGFRPKGVGWYRRRFRIENVSPEMCYYLEFDGVFRNSTVWLNANRLGTEPSGYTTFRYDVTDVINRGGTNTLAVRVDATGFEGWWYEGTGIYRHVWLVAVPAVHVAPWGVFVAPSFAKPSDLTKSVVKLETRVNNRGRQAAALELVSTILDPDGQPVAAGKVKKELAAEDSVALEQGIAVAGPKLWSVDSPTLYTLHTEVYAGGVCVDRVETQFGFRHARFDAEKGFFLNNEPLKLQGTCNHQDHAGVGIAVPDAVQEYRIRQLKTFGCNAFRCAHNPPAPELLDACDRVGMLVMDETRKMESTPDGLRQLEAMVLRDRNHPSIIMWSMGNEEPLQDTVVGGRIVRTMIRHARKLDNTRPFTFAMSGASWGNEFSAELDIQGCNYGIVNLDKFHAANPAKPVFMSESSASVFTRGIYENDATKGYVSAYDLNSPPWWNTPTEVAWKTIAERQFMAGAFTWTGLDYKGEPQPLGWPCVNSHFGILDTCGFAKDISYYYRAWWSAEPVLHIFPHWNWAGREGQEISVWCYSNLDEVELFLNDKGLGRQAVPRWGHLEWKVKYAPGVLSAIGYRGGSVVLIARRETTGAPAALRVFPDRVVLRGDGEDVAVLRAAVVDSEGRVVPTAGNKIDFAVDGPGRVLGVGNGDPICHEPDVASSRSAFSGLCCALIQAKPEGGTVVVRANSQGLASGMLNLRVVPRGRRPNLAAVPPDPKPEKK